jgi:hypothetical protein
MRGYNSRKPKIKTLLRTRSRVIVNAVGDNYMDKGQRALGQGDFDSAASNFKNARDCYVVATRKLDWNDPRRKELVDRSVNAKDSYRVAHRKAAEERSGYGHGVLGHLRRFFSEFLGLF